MDYINIVSVTVATMKAQGNTNNIVKYITYRIQYMRKSVLGDL